MVSGRKKNYDATLLRQSAIALYQEDKNLTCKAIGAQLGIAGETVSRYLGDLRPSKDKPRWTKREVDFLLERAETERTLTIAKKLGKTPDAVRLKASELGITLNPNLNNYSAKYLAESLGKNPSVIKWWITSGLLKAQKVGERWAINTKDFAEFCLNHPEKVQRFDPEVLVWLAGKN